jgi:pantothenate kinase type III
MLDFTWSHIWATIIFILASVTDWLDGFIARFASEMKISREGISLVATGQYAPSVLPYCKNQFEYEEHLTLIGLYYIYNANL